MIKKIMVSIIVIGLVGLLVQYLNTSMKTRMQKDAEQWEQTEETRKKLEDDIDRKSRRVGELAGTRRCNTSDDCRAVGLGAKLCGGYKTYLIYSLADSNELMLLNEVEEYNKMASRLNELSMVVPNCGYPVPPVKCITAHCEMVTNQ